MENRSDNAARWAVSVSAETDAALRAHLAELGQSEAALSRFVEEAVRWRLLRDAVTEARVGFADLSPAEVETLANEAIAFARSGREG